MKSILLPKSQSLASFFKEKYNTTTFQKKILYAIHYYTLTNHTNNAMFVLPKKVKKFWFDFFTFFFLDFFLSFPFSGVESNEATDPGCEVEGESSFFGFNKYNMI